MGSRKSGWHLAFLLLGDRCRVPRGCFRLFPNLGCPSRFGHGCGLGHPSVGWTLLTLGVLRLQFFFSCEGFDISRTVAGGSWVISTTVAAFPHRALLKAAVSALMTFGAPEAAWRHFASGRSVAKPLTSVACQKLVTSTVVLRLNDEMKERPELVWGWGGSSSLHCGNVLPYGLRRFPVVRGPFHLSHRAYQKPFLGKRGSDILGGNVSRDTLDETPENAGRLFANVNAYHLGTTSSRVNVQDVLFNVAPYFDSRWRMLFLHELEER